MPLESYKPGSIIGYPGLCIYGRTGAGKTKLLGTMPGEGIVIDIPHIEGGTYVLEDKAHKVTVVSCKEWDKIDEIYWALRKKDSKQLPTVNFDELKWVAIDSVTAMQTLARVKVVKERDLKADPHDISQRERGRMNTLGEDMVLKFRALPYMTVFTAQERGFGNDEEGHSLGPAVQPGLLTTLLQSLMIVGRMSVTPSGRRLLRVGPHDLYITKCRAKPGREIPSVIRDPNLEGILRYLLANGPKPKAYKETSLVLE